MPVRTFGLDISHHQGYNPDMRKAAQEGVEFCIIKSTEGKDFVDSMFTANLGRARAAGMLVAAYHYVRSNATAQQQVDNVKKVVPLDVPVIPDVENNSGDVVLLRAFVARLQQAGYHVPLTYLPKWYWERIGKPDLRGLPSLWSSRYPDNVVGSIADEYAHVPESYWNGYGGLGVTLLQFSSSARCAGYASLDANAYLGTKTQLAAVFGATTSPSPTPSPSTEDDMVAFNVPLPELTTAQDINIALPWEGGITVNKVTAMLVAGEPGLHVNVAHWRRQQGSEQPVALGALDSPIQMVPDNTDIVAYGRTAGLDAPAGCHMLVVNYTGSGAVIIEGAK